MWLLIKSELRDIQRNLLNTILVTLSLCIGVISVLVTHELSVSIVDRFRSTGIQGAFDQVIQLSTKSESEYFDLRRRWRSGELPTVTHLVPVINGVITVDGKVFDVLGYDPIALLPTNGEVFQGVQADSQFLLEPSVLAFGTELTPDDRIRGALVLRNESSLSRRLVADLPTAQTMLEREGEIDAVWLRVASVASPWWDRLMPGLLAATLAENQVLTVAGYEVQPFGTWQPSQQLGDAIVFNLGLLSLLTLLVAGFIVFQAIQSNLRNRVTQVALLNSIGVSSKQQRLLILFQCLLFGIAGCLLGVLGGLTILAWITDSSFVETWHKTDSVSLAKATVLGITTALLVGVLARQQAARPRTTVWWIATSLAVLGIAYGNTESSGLLGASVLSVCFCILSIFCVVPLAIRGATFILRRLETRSIPMRMDLRNALFTSSDIRLAINALAIAVATAIGIGLMLGSFRSEFSALLDQRLVHDLNLSDAANVRQEELAKIPRVSSVRAYWRGTAMLNDSPIELVAGVLDTAEQHRYGYVAEAQPGIFINEIASRRYNLYVGDQVTLDIARDTVRPITVLHVFKDYGEFRSRGIVSSDLVQLEALVKDRFSVDTTDPDGVRATLAERYPNVQVLKSAELRNAAIEIFDASFATAQIMVNIAIVVAVIGMACALIGLQAKRLKEMRLLTMMGSSRTRLALSALLQNATIGAFATLVALPLSFAIAWNLCYHVNPRAYGWSFDLELAWQPILTPILLGIVAATLAGLEPMRRALNQVVSQPVSNVR